MASESRKFKVGVFVFVSFLLIILTFLLYGVQLFSAKSDKYSTYFAESVQGLSADSDVRYRGIKVGIVSQINIAPDGELVEIVLKLWESSKFHVCSSNIVTLEGSALTGIKYVEIEMSNGRELKTPKISFKPEYPLIPSHSLPGLSTVLESFEDKLNALNTKEISDQIIKALNTLNAVFTTEQWSPIYTNIDLSVQSIKSFTATIDDAIGNDKLNTIINDAKISANKVKEITDSIDPAQIDDFINKLNTLADKLNKSTYICENSVLLILSDLQRSANNLKAFTEALKDRPSQTLFSKPQKDQK